MGWEQSDTWQWWLHYGFDGIGGAVIGGVITGAAVWATMRHERTIRDEDRAEAAFREVHAAVMRLRLELNRLRLAPPTDGSDLQRTVWIHQMINEVSLAGLAVRTASPELYEDLRATVTALERCGSQSTLKDALRALEIAGCVVSGVHRWQEDPQGYDGAIKARLARLEAKSAGERDAHKDAVTT